MIARRKKAKWVVLGDGHLRLADPPPDTLSTAERTGLAEAYRVVVLARKLGSDALQLDPALASELAREFTRRTGRVYSSAALTAWLVARRKRGELETLRPKQKPEVEPGRKPWDDIDEAGREVA